jgi:acyl-CoA reductase-like NAD-dependent aldehyde dehydrogenase
LPEGQGLFLQPTILTGVSHDHALAQEEIFGPVACLFSWENFDSVIELANSTVYGLAATVWTPDLNKALIASEKLEAGLVQINQNIVVQANLPYGGFKHSGLGQEASRESMLEHFTKRKTIIILKAAVETNCN